VLRIREATKLQVLGKSVEGRVVRTSSADEAGRLQIECALSKGVRGQQRPQVGDRLEWADTVVFSAGARNSMIYQDLKESRPLLVYGDTLPVPAKRYRIKNLVDMLETLKAQGRRPLNA
jgi:hypothetical protein